MLLYWLKDVGEEEVGLLRSPKDRCVYVVFTVRLISKPNRYNLYLFVLNLLPRLYILYSNEVTADEAQKGLHCYLRRDRGPWFTA